MSVIVEEMVMQRVAVVMKQSERETGDILERDAIGRGQGRYAAGDGRHGRRGESGCEIETGRVRGLRVGEHYAAGC